MIIDELPWTRRIVFRVLIQIVKGLHALNCSLHRIGYLIESSFTRTRS
jgi:hypothetical protein